MNALIVIQCDANPIAIENVFFQPEDRSEACGSMYIVHENANGHSDT
jgi:hypothetical protein